MCVEPYGHAIIRSIYIKYSKLRHPQVLSLLYSVALVRKRTTPTERPQPVGEVSANFSG